MQSTSERNRCIAGLLGALVLLSGCGELVHMGQISDRESAFAVNGVEIEQQQPDGSWKELGTTDGRGRWWILKDQIKPGRPVRLKKRGYRTEVMSDSEFMQQNNMIMMPEPHGD